ncbi:GPW/gp25 family protein [Fibrivirga algicola]|uniref:GPW/gp25 family protein n=1 Tax=Fibrivirga algicola TaxID=2950420 RepID=A0ABX0QI65_9BACT|nr:GPW/gp25 family protein [Fibrivirga algicola]NID12114.1 GPW/gp25 family protein [Fibrivirga algicola]
MDYYALPPSFGALMKRQSLDKLPLAESVVQNIALYLATRPNEYQYDPQYGCILHNYQFHELNDTPTKDQIKRSIETYLRKFDQRIEPEQVDVDVTDIEEKVDGRNPRICRYVQIVIQCRLTQTRELLPDMKFRVVRYS